MSAEMRDAIELRNRLIALLLDRVNVVRSAARFVFRDDPIIAREATSAYTRRRRAAARRASATAEADEIEADEREAAPVGE